MKKFVTGIIVIAAYILLILFLSILSCSNSADKGNPSTNVKTERFPGYNFTDPDETFILPAVLHEISGIALIDTSSIACVQDENGIVFIYDKVRNEIRRQILFHGNGDFEGITRVNNIIYVLRSDGVLFEIKNFKSSDVAREIPLDRISGMDNEGLCYDRKHNRLLIAHKEKPEKESDDKFKRAIFGFDLNRGELIKDPVISFNLSSIKKFAADNKVLPPEKNKKKDGEEKKPDIKFRPSAIGIHPLTNKLFVISGTEQMLFVFNLNGTIEDMIKLDPDIFNMPEGITFFQNGDVLISNEGQNKMATLLRFNYKPD